MANQNWSIFPVGDNGILIELGTVIDKEINNKVHIVAKYIKDNLTIVLDVIPAYTTILVIFPPGQAYVDWDNIVKKALSGQNGFSSESQSITIPVLYGGKFGPDLEEVANHNQLEPQEVIQLHSWNYYRLYCLGFSPGFSFLGQIPASIKSPRRSIPRSHVAPGSIGIAEQQTGIYALSTPGGWQIIGRCPLVLFRPKLEKPIPYKPSDQIQFQPIDENTFNKISNSQSHLDPWPSWLWEGGVK